MTLDRRLAAALALTAATTLGLSLSPDGEDAVAEPAVPRREAGARAPAPSIPPAAVRAAMAWPALADEAATAWGTPPPPPPPTPEQIAAAKPPPPPPPPPPQAPPFPYQLIGRFDDGSGAQVLMTGPMRTVSARADDVIDGQWRVEGLSATGVTLLWIPGGLRQTLNYSSS